MNQQEGKCLSLQQGYWEVITGGVLLKHTMSWHDATVS